jgi:hypothetical protein
VTVYAFEAELWLWTASTGPGQWQFITLPEDIADQIDDALTGPRAGFGSVKVRVTTGSTTWDTSLFPSKEHASFILPIKKSVRAAEGLNAGARAAFNLEVMV